MRRKDQHRLRPWSSRARRAPAAGRATSFRRPLSAKTLRAGIVEQRDVEMHAGAGIFLDRLGHEAGGDAVAAGGGAHQPLQHDEIVGGLQHVLAVVERQLVLAGRIFGDHRLGRDALRGRPQRRCRKTAAPCRADGRPNRPRSCRSCGRRARRSAGCTRPSASRSLASRKNSSSKAPAGCRPLSASAATCRASAWRGSDVIGCAVEMVHRHQHLAARRLRAVERHQRAGDRPAAQVAVAGIPDQAGLVDVLAGDVEAEDRDRQMPAALVEAEQFVAADDLAAADAVGVGEHDVEGLDLGMRVEEGLGFIDAGTGRGTRTAADNWRLAGAG